MSSGLDKGRWAGVVCATCVNLVRNTPSEVAEKNPTQALAARLQLSRSCLSTFYLLSK